MDEPITTEVYRLTLEHYMEIDGTHIKLEDPFVAKMAYLSCDGRYIPRAVCINEIFDKMKHEMLRRMCDTDSL